VLLSPTENDRFCSLLNAEINAASNECKKLRMGVFLAKVRRFKGAIATCPLSSRPEIHMTNSHDTSLGQQQIFI